MNHVHPLLRAALAVAAALSLGWGSAHATPHLIVVGGILMGADNVIVNNVAYDVRFVDGSCAGLYDDCNAGSDFTFQSRASANAAAAVLLRSVLVDTDEGRFDSNPALVEGCEASRCMLFTPYQQKGSKVFVVGANNTRARDRSAASRVAVGSDTSLNALRGYAVWTRHAEPGAATVTPDTSDTTDTTDTSFTARSDDDGFSGDPAAQLPAAADDGTVAEPGTLALLGLALPMFGWAARRRAVTRKAGALALG